MTITSFSSMGLGRAHTQKKFYRVLPEISGNMRRSDVSTTAPQRTLQDFWETQAKKQRRDDRGSRTTSEAWPTTTGWATQNLPKTMKGTWPPVLPNRSSRFWAMKITTSTTLAIPDSYPIPSQEEIIAQLRGKKFILVVDASSFFHQLPVAEEHLTRENRFGSRTKGRSC
jgi:hypothetical protein